MKKMIFFMEDQTSNGSLDLDLRKGWGGGGQVNVKHDARCMAGKTITCFWFLILFTKRDCILTSSMTSKPKNCKPMVRDL